MAARRPAFDAACQEGDVAGAQAAFDVMADERLAARKGVPVPRAAPPAVRKRPAPRQTGREGQASDRRADAALLK
eukprot:161523-Lingulodinium_polyedra.AAC.1